MFCILSKRSLTCPLIDAVRNSITERCSELCDCNFVCFHWFANCDPHQSSFLLCCIVTGEVCRCLKVCCININIFSACNRVMCQQHTSRRVQTRHFQMPWTSEVRIKYVYHNPLHVTTNLMDYRQLLYFISTSDRYVCLCTSSQTLLAGIHKVSGSPLFPAHE